MSHARHHYLKHQAQALTAEPMDRSTANAYELMLAQLAEHKRRLKGIQSFEHRAEIKRQFLPEYQPWVEGVLQGDSGQPDTVLMTVMVWLIDIGDIGQALPIARYALKNDLAMPDQYQRTTACVLAEETAERALRELGQEEQDEAAFMGTDLIADVIALVDHYDMPDQVRAKLYKAFGYGLRAAGELEPARQALLRALDLNDRAGVKKDIERLDTDIARLAEGKAPTERKNRPAGTKS